MMVGHFFINRRAASTSRQAVQSLVLCFFGAGIGAFGFEELYGQPNARQEVSVIKVTMRVVQVRSGKADSPLVNSKVYIVDDRGEVVPSAARQPLVTDDGGLVTANLSSAGVYYIVVDVFPHNNPARTFFTLLPDVVQFGPIVPDLGNLVGDHFGQKVTIPVRDLKSMVSLREAEEGPARLQKLLDRTPIGGPLKGLEPGLKALQGLLEKCKNDPNFVIPKPDPQPVPPRDSVRILPLLPHSAASLLNDAHARALARVDAKADGIDPLRGEQPAGSYFVVDSWGGELVGMKAPLNPLLGASIQLKLPRDRAYKVVFRPPAMTEFARYRPYPAVVSICRGASEGQVSQEFDGKVVATCPLAHEMTKVDRDAYLREVHQYVVDTITAHKAALAKMVPVPDEAEPTLQGFGEDIVKLMEENQNDRVPNPLDGPVPVSVLMHLTKSFPTQDGEWTKLFEVAAKYPETEFWGVCDYNPVAQATLGFRNFFAGKDRPGNLHVLGYLPMHTLTVPDLKARITGAIELGAAGALVDGFSETVLQQLSPLIDNSGPQGFRLFVRSSGAPDQVVFDNPYVGAVIIEDSTAEVGADLVSLGKRRMLPRGSEGSISLRIGVGVYDRSISLEDDFATLMAAWRVVVESRSGVVCLTPHEIVQQNGFDVLADSVRVPQEPFLSRYLDMVSEHNKSVAPYWDDLRSAGIYRGF